MSHFIEFSVDGLAGRKETYARRLNRDVNIFFGSNGSGKTSLLKILHSAMSNEPTVLENVAFTKAEVQLYSLTYDRAFKRTVSQPTPVVVTAPTSAIPPPEITKSVKGSAVANWVTVPKVPEAGGFAETYLPISRLYHGRPATAETALQNYHMVLTGKATGLSEQDLDLRFAESLRQIWRSYSAQISKAVREAQQKGLANILRAVLSPTTTKESRNESPDSKQAYRRVASFLARESGFSNVLGSEKQFEAKYSRDRNLRNVVGDIEEVEKSIEKAAAPRERLRELVNSLLSGGKEVVFSDTDVEIRIGSNRPLELPLLSSGEKQLLYILVHTLIAGPNTILIDEPEISMHVDWQKILVKTMQTINPELQIILATHSPEIMADVSDSCIFRL
jgi:energy-coupling factor transporter ATP-binding protein EcfA2